MMRKKYNPTFHCYCGKRKKPTQDYCFLCLQSTREVLYYINKDLKQNMEDHIYNEEQTLPIMQEEWKGSNWRPPVPDGRWQPVVLHKMFF